MKTTGDEFINLLYLSELDEKILKMRRALDAPRPLLDKEFKEDGDTSIVLKNYSIELFFSDTRDFDIENSALNKNDVIFSQIDYGFDTNLVLPLNLLMGDSYNIVVQKLKRKEDKDNSRFLQKVWKFKRSDGKFYLIYAYFGKDNKLIKLTLSTYDDNKKYVKI